MYHWFVPVARLNEYGIGFVIRWYTCAFTFTVFAMSGLWFVIRIVVESLAPAFTKFTKPTRLTPLYVPGTQASTLDVMPSACTFPSRAARTDRRAFVQPAPCCRMS